MRLITEEIRQLVIFSLQAKVSRQDNSPPVGLTEPLKITVTYYTDKPKKGTIPNSVEILDYEAVSPFIEGETIMMEEMSFPIAADGTVSFNLNIPDDAATGTIMVSREIFSMIGDDNPTFFRSLPCTILNGAAPKERLLCYNTNYFF